MLVPLATVAAIHSLAARAARPLFDHLITLTALARISTSKFVRDRVQNTVFSSDDEYDDDNDVRDVTPSHTRHNSSQEGDDDDGARDDNVEAAVASSSSLRDGVAWIASDIFQGCVCPGYMVA
jgi:hypothetical protein